MKMALAIIDGTGRWPDTVYKEKMEHSFCFQLFINVQKFNKSSISVQYERGPSDEGYRIKERGQRAADFLSQEIKKGASQVFVSGYSRGGSCAVFAAQILQELSVSVTALILFDPVARHFTPGGEGIPGNVLHSRIAIRTKDLNLVKKYENSIPLEIYGVKLFDDWCNPMRPEFGNIDLSPETKGDHEVRLFKGSHGALGGVGWPHVAEDPECQNDVAKYINRCFGEFGITSALKSFPPT